MTVVASDAPVTRFLRNFPPRYPVPERGRDELCSPLPLNYLQQDTHRCVRFFFTYCPNVRDVLPPLRKLHNTHFLHFRCFAEPTKRLGTNDVAAVDKGPRIHLYPRKETHACDLLFFRDYMHHNLYSDDLSRSVQCYHLDCQKIGQDSMFLK